MVLSCDGLAWFFDIVFFMVTKGMSSLRNYSSELCHVVVNPCWIIVKLDPFLNCGVWTINYRLNLCLSMNLDACFVMTSCHASLHSHRLFLIGTDD